MAARERYQVSSVPGEGQRACARGPWCSAATRDAEGAWHPALTWQPFCHACTTRIVTCVTEIPALYFLLGALIGESARRGGTRVRVSPGPRIPVSAGKDALMRETAPVIAGWAARVRAIPGLRLVPPEHPPGTVLRVREDCAVLAIHVTPLLALQDGWTSRVYDLPGGQRAGTLNRAVATCRRCGRTVTRSPVSGWWWSVAHPSLATQFCDHDPGPVTELPARGPVPDDIESDIGGEEIIFAAESWVRVTRLRGGTHAGEEILDLHHKARKLAGYIPARPETLDGIPCRACDEMGTLELIEQPPPDPEKPEPPYVRCTECGDEMTRTGLAGHTDRYAKWATGAGLPACRRCQRGDHQICAWDACPCRASGHAAA